MRITFLFWVIGLALIPGIGCKSTRYFATEICRVGEAQQELEARLAETEAKLRRNFPSLYLRNYAVELRQVDTVNTPKGFQIAFRDYTQALQRWADEMEKTPQVNL